jgi:hypothetical protein
LGFHKLNKLELKLEKQDAQKESQLLVLNFQKLVEVVPEKELRLYLHLPNFETKGVQLKVELLLKKQLLDVRFVGKEVVELQQKRG